VIALRDKPLTGLRISTLAPTTTAPDGSQPFPSPLSSLLIARSRGQRLTPGRVTAMTATGDFL